MSLYSRKFMDCTHLRLPISCLILLLAFNQLQALRFYVETNDKKCIKEEIHKNVVVTGEYELSEAIGHAASIHVSNFTINK